MADPDSMTGSEAAGKMLTGEHADALRGSTADAARDHGS